MTDRPQGIVIALDGPAGSGKSSTAKAVAAELDYIHLDSGAFYRAITLAALDAGIPQDDWAGLTQTDLAELRVSSRRLPGGYMLQIAGEDVSDRIREPRVNAAVSTMAAVPAVRDWLLGALREAARAGGLVADGRDIGTVVFPDAELKVFLVCDPSERAVRRLREQGVAEPSAAEIQEEVARLTERDRRDENREVAPLLRAPDAVLLDTTGLDFGAQVRAILRLAEERAKPAR